MTTRPILLAGGSGVAGRWTARLLRAAHPDLPLLIGGRDLAKAGRAAAEIGNAEAVTLDLSTDDLGLGGRAVGAIAVLLRDETLAGLRFAQARGIPYLTISAGASEIAPDVVAYSHRPKASPVVLGAEWLAGAATVPALAFAEAFGRLDAITIGAVLDAQDTGGPATGRDMRRLAEVLPAALVRHDGAFVWRTGAQARARVRALDGTDMEAVVFSPFDVMDLATATGAPNVEFHLATGVTSSRRRGEPMSTEIVIDLTGADRAGRPLRTRHAIVHPEGGDAADRARCRDAPRAAGRARRKAGGRGRPVFSLSTPRTRVLPRPSGTDRRIGHETGRIGRPQAAPKARAPADRGTQ